MYSSSDPSSVRSSGGTDDGSSDLEDMDTSTGVFEAKRWSPPEEREREFFENGEFLPSAIDTTQHSYYAVCDRDKLGVRYRGVGSHAEDWGTVRANHPLPRRRRMFYFEAKIASQGHQGSITIGLARGSFPMNKQPGTERGSYGLEGSNGYVLTGSTSGRSFGHALSTGDTVGLGVNFKKMEAFLTHNGQLLGSAFPDIRSSLDTAGLYPCVGLHSPGEAVRLNFGQRPFLFDLSASVAEEDSREQAAVAAVHVCPSLLRSLVRDYLLHQGCEETLRSLGKADGEGETWTKDPVTKPKGGTLGSPPLDIANPSHAAENGCAHDGESCNGASGAASPRPLPLSVGGSRSSAGPWDSTESEWVTVSGEGSRGGQGHNSSGGGSRRASESMDVEEGTEGMTGGRVGSGLSTQGRQRTWNEQEQGGGGERERRSYAAGEGGGRNRRHEGGRGSGGLGSLENAAAGDLLRTLTLHLGGRGGIVFGGGSGAAGAAGSGGTGAGSSGHFFVRRQGGAAGGRTGEERRSRRQRRGRNQQEQLQGRGQGQARGEESQQGQMGEGAEEIMEQDEEEEEEDEDEEEEEEDEEEEEEEDDDEEEDNDEEEEEDEYAEVVGDDDEEENLSDPDPEHDVLAAVLPPWIPRESEPLREVVHPIPVTELLADGARSGAGVATGAASLSEMLAATLSFRTRLRQSILSGDIDGATALLQTERPGLLERRPDVRFALKCQAFIELVKKGDLTTAVALAQRELSPFRDYGRTIQDPLQKDSSASTHLHLTGGEIYAGSETSLSGTVGSSPLGVGTSRGARSGSRREGSGRAGMGGRGSGTRLKEARSSAADFSESEEDGMERRTRKRRTRSYDCSKPFGDGQDSDWEAGDRSFGSASEQFRKSCFPSTLCGAPSIYDSKLVAVMGLLVYKDPANSPLGHLVSNLQNQAIADKVNDAVLAAEVTSRKGPETPHSTHMAAPVSGLEMVVKHLLATRQASRETAGDGGHAAVHPHLYF